jgi:hypothetical protein
VKKPLLVSAVILAVMLGSAPSAFPAEPDRDQQTLLLVDVQLDKATEFSRLKPGDKLHGRVKYDVYSGDRLIIPLGSPIVLTVSKTERGRRESSDRWPWIVRLFTPRHANHVTALIAMISLPDGSKLPMPVYLASEGHEVKLTPQETGARGSKKHGKKPRAASSHKDGSGPDDAPTLILKAERPHTDEPASGDSALSTSSTPQRLAAGTVAHVVLLGGLRASKCHSGDSFLVRLEEPVRVNSQVVLPEGVLIQGKVVKSVPPRWLSRSGAIHLTFTELRFPSGQTASIVASPSGAIIDRASGLRMDSEGGLMAGRPGKAAFFINLGVTGGVSKAADDTFQLIVEALISTATDASTAGSAKIVASAISGIYLLARHGRDVSLPAFTRMDISLDRPVVLPSATRPDAITSASSTATVAAGTF